MKKTSAFTGAAFLMATSAIGPGFLTQTARFTADLYTSFGFIILISVVLDIAAQLNIWRIITVSNLRAQELASSLLPGLGLLLALMVGFGGLAFNIGNMAGTGLGLQALSGLDAKTGAVISCVLALAVFWYKEAGALMDQFTKWLGLAMILLTLYVAFTSSPPVGEALFRTVWPQTVDAFKIVTLVGGTVGGYISFAGAHRLLDAGISGKQNLKRVTATSIRGILITSLMRYVLFLAAVGVVSQGLLLSDENPAAAVFGHAAGEAGYRFFGFVMWCAAITSVVGASYTSISFIKTLHPFLEKHYRSLITVFILVSTLVFLWLGSPVRLLVLAGAVNGLILPAALAIILIASGKQKIMGDYTHPLWMKIAGWVVVFAMGWMGWITIQQNLSRL